MTIPSSLTMRRTVALALLVIGECPHTNDRIILNWQTTAIQVSNWPHFNSIARDKLNHLLA